MSAVPQWLTEVRPDSTLNIRDVAALLGISASCLSQRVSRGAFPPADYKVRDQHQFSPGRPPLTAGNARQWYVSTVLRFLREGA